MGFLVFVAVFPGAGRLEAAVESAGVPSVGGVVFQQDESRAEAVIRESLRKLGDSSRIAGLKTLRIVGEGIRYWKGQGRNPGSPIGELPRSFTTLVDYTNGRALTKATTYQSGTPYFCMWSVYTKDLGFNFECVTSIYMPVSARQAERSRTTRVGRYPEPRGLLMQALSSSGGLDYLGVVDLDGRRNHAIGFGSGRNNGKLFIDSTSGLLSMSVMDSINTVLGRTASWRRWDDYRLQSGLMIPYHVTFNTPLRGGVGSVITDDMFYDSVEIDARVADDEFKLAKEHFVRRPDTIPTITRMQGGVFFIENARPNYNQLVVEFDEYLLVVDAPFSKTVSTKIIDLIRDSIADKPIRYIVPTHFHYDHIGGLPAYVREGATVLSTAQTRVFVQELVEKSFPGSKQEISTLVISGERSISDGTQTVSLYDIGPNPHVDEMLMMYLPDIKTLYVADLLSADWGQVRPAIPETYALARRLTQLGIDVETFLPSHGPAVSYGEFQHALEAGRTLKKRSESRPPAPGKSPLNRE